MLLKFIRIENADKLLDTNIGIILAESFCDVKNQDGLISIVRFFRIDNETNLLIKFLLHINF